MTLYMRIENGAAVGFPVPRPVKVQYTDPNTNKTGNVGAVNFSDAELLAQASLAPVDPAFILPLHSQYAGGGTYDDVANLATPNVEGTPIETLRSEARQAVNSAAEAIRLSTAGNPGTLEMMGWSVKAARAKRILDATASQEDTDIVQMEADKRGLSETVTALATIQAAKDELLSSAISIIDGHQTATLAAIDAATDPADPGTLAAQFQVNVATDLAALGA